MWQWICAAVRPASGDGKRCDCRVRTSACVWIPAGFAHGFCVLSETAHVLYKATNFYSPEDKERTLAWNDPDLKINWELSGEPIVSAKDQRGIALRGAEVFA